MDKRFIGIGLSMVALATILTGLGHYDGILGADAPDQVMAQERATTFRVMVTGTPEDAQEEFRTYREQLVVSEAMLLRMEDRTFVPVTWEAAGQSFNAFLTLDDSVPPPGEALVVSGKVFAEWPLFDAGARTMASMPILFVEADDYHEPILFKR